MLSSRDHQLLIGAQAFDDLTMALETLGQVRDMTWVKEQTDLLKSTKRYLKSDYKVMVCASVPSIVLYRIWDCSCADFLWSQFLKQKFAVGIISICGCQWSNLDPKVCLCFSSYYVALKMIPEDGHTHAQLDGKSKIQSLPFSSPESARVLGQWTSTRPSVPG